eukprot:80483_1
MNSTMAKSPYNTSTIRSVPKSMIPEAYEMMMDRKRTDIPSRYRKRVSDFGDQYCIPTWIGSGARFNHDSWNEYNKEIRANNHAESLNHSRQIDIGSHPPFYHWIWNSKKHSQKHLSRWRAYNHGHKRQRKVKEHRKNLNLITLWGLIATNAYDTTIN